METAMELSQGDAVATPSGSILASPTQDSVPVYVMLPLDTINADGVFRYANAKWFNAALQELKETGIHGVAVDVWWGAVERRPRRYDWSGYRQLFDLVSALGLRLQVVLAFHACGGNVGDNAEVPLPPWVVAAGERDPDIFFTDKPREMSPGRRNRECISLFADEEPGLLKGRSPMQCYVDFMRSFRDEFMLELGGLIEEVVVGTGPCGELRYPSYPESNGWRFPGVGEFQCYDRRALASLARAAALVGNPEWGNSGPHDAGTYNATPEETAFFRGWDGGWDSPYGRFFLSWYSQSLVEHGDRMLHAATSVFNTQRTPRSMNGDGITDDASLSSRNESLDGGNVAGRATILRQGSTLSDVGQDTGGGGAGALYDGTRGSSSSLEGFAPAIATPRGGAQDGAIDPGSLAARSEPSTSTGNGGGNGGVVGAGGYGAASVTGPAPLGLPSRPPSYASFRSSSISEGLNMLEEWAWPSPAGPAVNLTLKIAGVHWWYRTRSHAAELAAGYFNCDGRQGYEPIVALCARHGVALTLTCVEMCDAQHPAEALCGPEGLLRQVREAAAAADVPLGGENALPCFMPNAVDEIALQRVVYNTQPWGTPLQQGVGGGSDSRAFGAMMLRDDDVRVPMGTAAPAPARRDDDGGALCALLPPMRSFTFLRLTPDMMTPSYQDQWHRFMRLMARNAQKFKTSPGWRKNMGFL